MSKPVSAWQCISGAKRSGRPTWTKSSLLLVLSMSLFSSSIIKSCSLSSSWIALPMFPMFAIPRSRSSKSSSCSLREEPAGSQDLRDQGFLQQFSCSLRTQSATQHSSIVFQTSITQLLEHLRNYDCPACIKPNCKTFTRAMCIEGMYATLKDSAKSLLQKLHDKRWRPTTSHEETKFSNQPAWPPFAHQSPEFFIIKGTTTS